MSLQGSLKVKTNSHILWEGHPPIPSQPSSSAFRFLRGLNKDMGALGSDVWAPGSVEVLKSSVADEVVKAVQEHLDAITASTKEQSPSIEKKDEGADPTATGDGEKADVTPPSPNHDEAKEQRVKQLFFDLLYIQRFVGDTGADDAKLTALVQKTDMVDLDEAAINRLRKNAADYSKKTYLLFALLA